MSQVEIETMEAEVITDLNEVIDSLIRKGVISYA